MPTRGRGPYLHSSVQLGMLRWRRPELPLALLRRCSLVVILTATARHTDSLARLYYCSSCAALRASFFPGGARDSRPATGRTEGHDDQPSRHRAHLIQALVSSTFMQSGEV